MPMYSKFREHPAWAAILKQSNNRVAEQKKIYLKLIEEAATPAI